MTQLSRSIQDCEQLDSSDEDAVPLISLAQCFQMDGVLHSCSKGCGLRRTNSSKESYTNLTEGIAIMAQLLSA